MERKLIQAQKKTFVQLYLLLPLKCDALLMQDRPFQFQVWLRIRLISAGLEPEKIM